MSCVIKLETKKSAKRIFHRLSFDKSIILLVDISPIDLFPRQRNVKILFEPSIYLHFIIAKMPVKHFQHKCEFITIIATSITLEVTAVIMKVHGWCFFSVQWTQCHKSCTFSVLLSLSLFYSDPAHLQNCRP